VIGSEIVRYDTYGPDVMIANKMESNGESGRVMVSESTMQLLTENYSPTDFSFTNGNSVYIKHFHKTIQGYFVTSNKIYEWISLETIN